MIMAGHIGSHACLGSALEAAGPGGQDFTPRFPASKQRGFFVSVPPNIHRGPPTMVLRWSLVAISCVSVIFADHPISSGIVHRFNLISGDASVKRSRLPLRLSKTMLRLAGGADVAKRKVLDEYTHEIKSRHEGKSGAVSVEVCSSCLMRRKYCDMT